MSRDFYRNRCKLGSVPQLDAELAMLTKNLDFNSSTDLTDNFTQNLGSGSTQTVTGGVVQFRNSNYDQSNDIISKFTMNFINKVTMRLSTTAGSVNYWYPCWCFVEIVNLAGEKVDRINLFCCYSYSYSEQSWAYYNNGYVYWKLDSQSNSNQSLAQSQRLMSAPSSGYHITEISDNENGTINIKVDGTQIGTNLSLGNSNYRLGKAIGTYPINGWYNNQKYADLDYMYITYSI